MTRPIAAIAALSPLAVACDDSPSTPPVEPETRIFATPIAGELSRDWFVNGYVDADDGVGEYTDYECGPKSYDGHQGTDLVLPDFHRMDEGVDVLAAAAGTVWATHDGEFDRHKVWQDTVPWNVVAVDHGERHGYRYFAYYGHLKNGSIAVTEGQSVSPGTVLGEVGSSGRSDMPHLHFEVRRAPVSGVVGVVADPWEGACGAGSSLWLDQIPYQDEFRPIQAGLSVDSMSLDRVKDPPTPVTAVTAGGQPGAVSAWVQLHNQRAGAVTSWEWRRPDGTTFGQTGRTHTRFYSMSWWWTSVPLAAFDEAGTWSVEIRSHGEPVVALAFDVTLAGAVEAAADRTPSVDGGGIR